MFHVLSDVSSGDAKESISLFAKVVKSLKSILHHILKILALPVSAQEMVDIVPSSNKMLLESVGGCLNLSEEMDRTSCYADLCEYEPGYLCAEDIVNAVTALNGPESGMQSLHEVLRSAVFNFDGDAHQLAHIIGRSAARHWGETGGHF